MNAQIASETGVSAGIGYAVPAETIREIVEQLKEDGRVEHPYLGVRLTDGEDGVEVVEVMDESPASRAGVEVGDVIVGAGGERVASGDDVRREVNERRPGDELELELRRDGDTRTVTATLRARPAASPG
jgi:S1-C subfamily serine protease